MWPRDAWEIQSDVLYRFCPFPLDWYPIAPQSQRHQGCSNMRLAALHMRQCQWVACTRIVQHGRVTMVMQAMQIFMWQCEGDLGRLLCVSPDVMASDGADIRLWPSSTSQKCSGQVARCVLRRAASACNPMRFRCDISKIVQQRPNADGRRHILLPASLPTCLPACLPAC